MKARTAVVVALASGSLFTGAPAMARPEPPAPPSIALHVDAAARAVEPGLGDQVTFDTTYSSTVRSPRIEVLCYQGGVLVYGEAGSADQAVQQQLTGSPGFTLGGGSSAWLSNGGGADCTANLFYWGSKGGRQTYNLLASTRFSATA